MDINTKNMDITFLSHFPFSIDSAIKVIFDCPITRKHEIRCQQRIKHYLYWPIFQTICFELLKLMHVLFKPKIYFQINPYFCKYTPKMSACIKCHHMPLYPASQLFLQHLWVEAGLSVCLTNGRRGSRNFCQNCHNFCSYAWWHKWRKNFTQLGFYAFLLFSFQWDPVILGF